MVYLWKVIWIWYKSFSNKTMNIRHFTFTVRVKCHNFITVAVIATIFQFLLYVL